MANLVDSEVSLIRASGWILPDVIGTGVVHCRFGESQQGGYTGCKIAHPTKVTQCSEGMPLFNPTLRRREKNQLKIRIFN
jgi:hypothetical protein